MLKSFFSKTFYFILGISFFIPQISHAAAPEFDINFQSVYAGPHVFNLEVAQPWVEEIAEKTNGRINAHFFMNGTLSKPEETVMSVMKGTIDMSGGGTAYNPELFPLSIHVALPYSTRDAIHSTELFQKLYNDVPQIKTEIDKAGKLLAIWGSDRTGFFSTKGPIRTVNDIKGKRVLIWSGNQVDVVKSWGGVPVQVSPNDTYIGLQRGMGDVFFGPLPVGVSYKVMEVAKDVTVINATVIPVFFWMNWDLWNDLPPDLQQIVEETVGTWGDRTGEGLVRATNKDIETMNAAGCTVYFLNEEEIVPFQEANMPVVREYVASEFKRLKVDRDADEWIKYVHDTADSLL